MLLILQFTMNITWNQWENWVSQVSQSLARLGPKSLASRETLKVRDFCHTNFTYLVAVSESLPQSSYSPIVFARLVRWTAGSQKSVTQRFKKDSDIKYRNFQKLPNFVKHSVFLAKKCQMDNSDVCSSFNFFDFKF